MIATLDPRETRLLNEFQRGFPLAREPYAVIAERLGTDVAWVRATLARFLADGRVSRVGAVLRPGAVGVSTLAALAVPEGELAAVAAMVSARPEVNHNYEREHRYNLWFVAMAADGAALDEALAAIARDTGYAPITLPLVADYWIDLAFDLAGAGKPVARAPRRLRSGQRTPPRVDLGVADRRLIDALAGGLPVCPQPYAALAAATSLPEAYVQTRIADWLNRGVITRLGIVVRHRELGYCANAMCVWDVPDAWADAVGEALAREPGVTLCYRRARALLAWRYNLYCMIHGRDRVSVLARIEALARAHDLDGFASAVLFSRRAFKQRGAHYALGEASLRGAVGAASPA